MSVKSHTPFYRQMSGALISLFCLSFLMSSVAGFLLYQRNVQVNNLVHNQIPQIEFSNKVNVLLQRNTSLTSALNQSKSIDELTKTFKKIQYNTDEISTLYRNKNGKVNTLKIEINNVTETLKRISGNNQVNESLKVTAIERIDTLNKILVKEIEDKTKEQSSLQRLVNNSGAYIYAGQANAYIDSIKTIVELNQIKELLDNALSELINLNLSLPTENVEKLTDKIDLAMQKWLSILTNISTDLDIKNRIGALDVFLNTEERVLSKWHSHLRLSNELFEKMTIINDELNTANTNQNVNTLNSDTINVLPPVINNIAKQLGFDISLKQFNTILITVFVLSLLLVVFLLFKIHTKLKEHGNNTVKLCENLLLHAKNRNELNNFVQSVEHTKMLNLAQPLNVSDYDESQSLPFIQTNSKASAFITDHHGIIHWQYIPEEIYIIDNDELLELCRASHQNISSWRHLFTKESIKNIISVAKNVRDSGATLSCIVNNHSGLRMDLLIDYDNKEWSGTLHRNDQVELLKSSLAQVKQKLKHAEVRSSDETTAITDRFSNMTLSAMLESQSGSIDSEGASKSVYRQLCRIFDWCSQSSIVNELESEGRKSLKSNVNLKNELNAIFLNATADAYIQQNKIYLQTDRLLMAFAQVEQRLLSRMLSGVIRIAIAELFNAKLLLKLKVVDLETGIQTVRFTFSVETTKPLEEIPELVNRLVNEKRSTNAPSDIIFYLRTLMYHLNINDVHTSLNEQGYSLFFDMQLIEGQEIVDSTETVLSKISLKGTHTLFLSNCVYAHEIVTDAVYGIGGDLTLLANYSVLATNYSRDVIEEEPVDLIVVGEDVFQEDINNVYAFVEALPKAIQPKICVMQPPIDSPIQTIGLYGQASAPICQKALQCQLVNLIESEHKNNSLIDAKTLSQFEYLPTRVEVLLAVIHPEMHQTLIRLLNWLGLQVKVVTQPDVMLKSWQSGRYLVLISEFSNSPLTMMKNGRNLQRGVFTFTDIIFDQPSDLIANIVKQWEVSKLPNVLDIKALTDTLKPWLKINTAPPTQKEVEVKELPTKERVEQVPTSKMVQINKINKTKKVESLSSSVNASETKLNDYEKAYIQQAEVLSEETNILPNDAAFDVSAYAENQGSFELAIYMLDDYIDDIQSGVTLIEEYLENNKLAETIPLFNNMEKAVTVLSAKDIGKSLNALKLNIKGCILSDQQDDKTPSLLKKVKDECQRLVKFSQSI